MRPLTAPPLSFVGAWQRTQRVGDRIRATAARAAYRVVVAPLVIAAWWLLVEGVVRPVHRRHPVPAHPARVAA
jgi:hypothetical protein